MEPINRIEETYQRLTSQGREVLRLFSGNPTEQGIRFPGEILKEVYGRHFDSGTYSPHPKGLPEARQSVARYYEREGVRIDPGDVILTAGTSESFLYLFSLLTRPGDNLLTPNPSYPLFDPIARMVGVDLKPYHLREEKNWALDFDDLERQPDSKTKAVILVSPHNPTGWVASAGEVQELVVWTNRKEIPLICDEVFSEFYFGKGSYPRPIACAKPRLCFTLNGISKMFALPALKLGWIAVTGEKNLVEPAVDRLETIADTFLSCHTPIQEALPLIFSRGQSFLEGYKQEVRRRKEIAIQLLRCVPGTRFVEPVGGFYLMAKVAESARHLLQLSEEEFVIRLMEEKGVFVHPGYFYDYEKGIHFVISFLTEEAKLRQGLRAIGQFLQTY